MRWLELGNSLAQQVEVPRKVQVAGNAADFELLFQSCRLQGAAEFSTKDVREGPGVNFITRPVVDSCLFDKTDGRRRILQGLRQVLKTCRQSSTNDRLDLRKHVFVRPAAYPRPTWKHGRRFRFLDRRSCNPANATSEGNTQVAFCPIAGLLHRWQLDRNARPCGKSRGHMDVVAIGIPMAAREPGDHGRIDAKCSKRDIDCRAPLLSVEKCRLRC